MRLKNVTIRNFRGYSQRTTIPIDECLTGFIGKNDSGKSSILEALGVFFNCESVTLDKDDFNVTDRNCQIEISCVFDNLPNEVIIDESNPTTLKDEYLLNLSEELEIKKVYKNTQPKSPLVFIKAAHPTAEGYNEIHKFDSKALKAKAKELGIDAKSIADQRSNSLWRKAIWNHCEDLKINEVDLGISEFAGDSKKLQEKILSLLPLYELFKVDRESKDNDPLAKSPLQEAVDLAKKELSEDITKLEEKVKQKVIERANATIEKLKEMDESLANALHPKFKSTPKWTFDFSIDGDDNIPINKRGSGARRLILLNFFRAEAERKINDRNAPSVIYAFEEPETSQHPNYQAMLLTTFIKLSQRENCQILLTTHVPSFCGYLPVKGLRYIHKINGIPNVEYGTEEIIEKIAKTLGVLPDPIPNGAKALLLVEGPSDVVFFRHAADVLKKNGQIPNTFEEKKIALVITGGCGTLKHWRTKKIAEQFNLPWGVFLDADLTNEVNQRVNQKHITELRAEGRKAHSTRKNEIENYIDESVLPLPSGTITITDISDAKNDIAKAALVRGTEVIERFWKVMTFDLIRKRETYVDNGVERYEITEIVNDFLSLADN